MCRVAKVSSHCSSGRAGQIPLAAAGVMSPPRNDRARNAPLGPSPRYVQPRAASAGSRMGSDQGAALHSPRGRGILAATVHASGMVFLDGTVVNVALPTLARELVASLSGLQWVVDAYLLTLSAFSLLGGTLGDVIGRSRVFLAGTLAFGATSALCGVAGTLAMLCWARALQGVAAALLVPSSLAILKSSIRAEDQDAAVGAWTGLSGVMTAVGPLAGGWLVETLSWRSIFFLNLPLALMAVVIGSRCLQRAVPRTRAALDWVGAALGAVCLGGLVYALIEGPPQGWPRPAWLSGVLGVVALAAFIAWERHAAHPMLPLALFRRRQFSAANLTTLMMYFGLSGAMFLVVLGSSRVSGTGPSDRASSSCRWRRSCWCSRRWRESSPTAADTAFR